MTETKEKKTKEQWFESFRLEGMENVQRHFGEDRWKREGLPAVHEYAREWLLQQHAAQSDKAAPVGGHEDSPLEALNKRIWEWLGRWGRWVAAVIVVAAVLEFVIKQIDAVEKVKNFFAAAKTSVSPDEINCLNEWVLQIAAADTEQRAGELEAQFLNNYKDFGHVNDYGEPIWINNVHVVRDIALPGKWLVVIDMYPGASSKECMIIGREEMLGKLDEKPDNIGGPGSRRSWDDRIGGFLRNSTPLCYDMNEFERAYGVIQTKGSDVDHQRSLGPCGSKLDLPKGKSCPDYY